MIMSTHYHIQLWQCLIWYEGNTKIQKYVDICKEFLKTHLWDLKEEEEEEEAVLAMHYCSQQTDNPRVSLCQSEVWKQMYKYSVFS